MSDREKLIELIESARYWGSNTSAEIADRLIAKGVVIQKKGLWVKRGYKWMCFDCQLKINIDGTPTENNLFYCPHCGAKMNEVK